MTDRNREFAELNGIPYTGQDYAADPRLVLEVVMKREDHWKFFAQLNYQQEYEGDVMQWIYVDSILDKTGLLRDAAIEWMKQRGKG